MGTPKTVEPRPEPRDPIVIDENALDQEVLDQSRRARRAGRELAKAEREVGIVKAAFDLVKADLKVLIRTRPLKFGLPDKPAMDLVDAAVVIQDKYQKAQREYIEAEFERDYVKAEQVAFQHRKSMLEKAVDLHQSGYHSEPKTNTRDAAATRTARHGIRRDR